VRFGQEHLARDFFAIFIAAGIDVVDLDGDVAAVVRIVRQVDVPVLPRPTSLIIMYLPIFSGKELRPFGDFA
jgi:hypothetical protein